MNWNDVLKIIVVFMTISFMVTIYLIVRPVDPIAQRIKSIQSFYFEDQDARNLIALIITNGKAEFEIPKNEESSEENKKK